MSFKRKLERNKEKKEIENIRNTYGKRPKGICPKCHKKTLFITNKDGNVICFRCEKIVSTH